MRWPTFAIFAFVMLAFDLGLGVLLRDPLGLRIGQPSFMMILLVFIAMNAPPMAAAWAAVVLGLLVDLTTDYLFHANSTSSVLVGPAVLGYMAGAYAVLQLRGVIFRQSRWAVPVMVMAGGAFLHLVMVAVLTLRGLPLPFGSAIADWHAAEQLFSRFFALLYTAAVAVPTVAVLQRCEWMWGFVHQTHWSRRGG